MEAVRALIENCWINKKKDRETHRETHNAVLDAQDELEIIQLLGYEIEEYDIALISDKKTSITKTRPSKAKAIHEEYKCIRNLKPFKKGDSQVDKKVS